jgi:hypothetical protein
MLNFVKQEMSSQPRKKIAARAALKPWRLSQIARIVLAD